MSLFMQANKQLWRRRYLLLGLIVLLNALGVLLQSKSCCLDYLQSHMWYDDDYEQGELIVMPDGIVLGKVDVVYMWANSSDQVFATERARYKDEEEFVRSSRTRKKKSVYSPTRTTGELKLSLRSLFKFGGSWLNNVFIVTTYGQAPYWLNTDDPRVHIVDANKLMAKVGGKVPTFNSEAITTLFPLIDGLGEHFITLDDDFILVKRTPLSKLFRLTKKTRVLSEVYHKTVVKRKCDPTLPSLSLQCKYTKEIMNMDSYWCAHSVRPYIKTRFLQFLDTFHEIVNITRQNRFRHHTDVDVTGVYPYFTEWYYGLENTSNQNLGRKQNFPVDTVVHDLKHRFWRDYGMDHVVNIALQDTDTTKYYDTNVRAEVVLTIFTTLATKYGLQDPSPLEKIDHAEWSSVQIVGHRGLGVSLPIPPHSLNGHIVSERIPSEETLANVKLAAQYIEWVELDVMHTKDKIVVANHGHKYMFEHCKTVPANLQKTIMKQVPYSYVRKYNISALREFLRRNHNLGFHVELKQDASYNKKCIREEDCPFLDLDPQTDVLVVETLKIIKDAKRENVYITAFDAQRLRLVKDIAATMNIPALKTILSWPMYDSMDDVYLDRIKNKWLVDGISISSRYVGNHGKLNLLAKIRSHGLFVQIGMPAAGYCLHELDGRHEGESIDHIREALSYKPDFLITNKPLVAKAIQMSLDVPII